MKVVPFLLLLLTVTASSLFAQEVIKPSAVPPVVMEEFQTRFADAENVVWLRQGEDYYGARFQKQGQEGEAIYTPTGEWIQTELNIAYQEMPDDARSYCRTNYPDYQARAVKKVSTRKYGILYEIRVFGGMKQVGMTFDMHGKLVEEKEIEEEVQEESGGVKGKFSKMFKKN